MKLLLFYPCLLAILLQAISASSSDGGATLVSKKAHRRKAKVDDRRTTKKAVVKKPSKEEGADKHDKGSIVPKEDKPKSLIELLLPDKKVIDIVIGYLNNISIRIATRRPFDWVPGIEVDRPRFYGMSGALMDFNYPFADLEVSGCRCTEFGNSQSGKQVGEKAVAKKSSKKKRADKHDKGSVVPKEKPKSLDELLPEKTPVEIVIGYLSDTYPITVSTHDWLFKTEPSIEVDGARVYVMSNYEGLKGLNHLFANVMESERRYIEFGDPRWAVYSYFSSSHDGRHVYFYHSSGGISIHHEKRTKFSAKLFTQGNESENGKPKRILFDSEEDSADGLLSRDGKALFSLSRRANVTRAYQIKEEAAESPVALMKFKLTGSLRAVSGDGKRVMVSNGEKLEIHSITDKDTSELICRIDIGLYFRGRCALNEDGSEAAFVKDGELRIVKVNEVVGDEIDQSAIDAVKLTAPLRMIVKLVYSDSGELHVLYDGGKVSLFDPSENALIPIETPQERHIVGGAISPNASHVATLHRVPKEDKGDGRLAFKTIVKRKLERADLGGHLECESDKAVINPK